MEKNNLIGYYRSLVYGDGTAQGKGMSSDPKFHDLFFKNACSYIDEEARTLLSLVFKCSDYDNGILTFGLAGSIQKWEEVVTKTVADLRADAFTNGLEIAANIQYIEAFTNQILATLFSVRDQIAQPIFEAAAINVDIVTPIQVNIDFSIF